MIPGMFAAASRRSGLAIGGGPDRHGYVTGEAVSFQFVSSPAAEVWSIVDGALPTGWSLDSETGEVTGRAEATETGTFNFTVQGDGAGGFSGVREFTVRLGSMSLLMHFEGADGSTTFIDETGKTITRNGNTAEIDTSFAKFGGSSGLFGGTAGFVRAENSADFAFGTGAFTVSCWLRPANVPGSLYYAPWGNWRSGQAGTLCLFLRPSRFMQVQTGSSGSFTILQPVWNAAGDFFHVEVSRDESNVLRVFVDGQKVGEWANVTENFTSSLGYRVGHNDVSSDQYPGHIDEMRVVKGVAEHVDDFDPPSAPSDFIAT